MRKISIGRLHRRGASELDIRLAKDHNAALRAGGVENMPLDDQIRIQKLLVYGLVLRQCTKCGLKAAEKKLADLEAQRTEKPAT